MLVSLQIAHSSLTIANRFIVSMFVPFSEVFLLTIIEEVGQQKAATPLMKVI